MTRCEEALVGVLQTYCTSAGKFDSMGIRSSAEALRALASTGTVAILQENSDRVIAELTKR